MPLTIAYWKIRGLASNIRFQLAYSGITDYEMVEYEVGDAPEYDTSSWFNVKPTLGLDFPNIPYLIDGDLKLTETLAIHRYLAD
jgi:glutathione S-transferase